MTFFLTLAIVVGIGCLIGWFLVKITYFWIDTVMPTVEGDESNESIDAGPIPRVAVETQRTVIDLAGDRHPACVLECTRCGHSLHTFDREDSLSAGLFQLTVECPRGESNVYYARHRPCVNYQAEEVTG